jgi:putative oxidoreductase
MLASMFVYGGLDALRHPEPKAPKAAGVASTIDETLGVEAEPADLVRVNGAVQVVAGTTLGLGVFPRLSALALAGSLVPTTLAGHRFWEEIDPAARAQQRIHFLKNTSMMGGLLLAALDRSCRRKEASRRRRQE